MGEDLELRFVCKLCDKRYPCGKSLGGHMRSHVIANSAESDEKLEPNVTKESSSLKDSRFELGGHSGYGLRENPRKTWRVSSGSNLPSSQQEKICKQCGKGFQSLKALCGHMASHSSEKERVLKDDHSWTSENQKLVMMDDDSHSDTESEAPRQRQPKRSAASSSTRYDRIVIKSSSLVNGSSSVSEIDHEQEEVAICLMMLSRDFSGNWVGFNSFADSSDNNSVVLETKSSSSDLPIGRNKGLNCSQKLGKGKFKSGDLEDEQAQFESSDSGYFMNGPKKVDSDVSTDGFLTNDNFKNQKLEEGRSRFKLSDTELGKGLISKANCRGTELRNGSSKQKGYDEIGIPSISNHSRKRIANGSYNPDSYGATYKKMSRGYSNVENAPKRSKHESGSSNKKQMVRDSSCNNGDGRLIKSKKSKGHECPICHRIFKSGQALGGHKRSHFLGGSEQKSNQTVQNSVIKEEEVSDIPDLLDLNFPAPPEEEANEHAQFVPW